MYNPPSTPRTPNDDEASVSARRHSFSHDVPQDFAAHTSALDGLHEIEDLSVEAWLHLSLGLETG